VTELNRYDDVHGVGAMESSKSGGSRSCRGTLSGSAADCASMEVEVL
jgi:hypothetical protein